VPRLANTLPPIQAPYLRSVEELLTVIRTRGFGYSAVRSVCSRSASLSSSEPPPVRTMLVSRMGRISTSTAEREALIRDGRVCFCSMGVGLVGS